MRERPPAHQNLMRFTSTRTRRNQHLPRLYACALVLCAVSGCGGKEEWDQFWGKFRDQGEQPVPMTPSMASRGKGLQGTIGQLVTIDGLRMTQVAGYGLVVGLVDTGGADGPDEVKNYLTKEIRRLQEIGAPGLPVEQLLGGRDSSMVYVTGYIPPGARKGDRIDVVIEALGTQTKSLVGGRLVLCELKLFAETPRGIIDGKPLARAEGPVFVSPFDTAGRPTSNVDLRRGMVLGGGVVREGRHVRLMLVDPRYSVTKQIESRINARFAGVDPLAVAKSAGMIEINFPAEMRDRKRVFLERVMHTTLNGSTPFLEQRARDLGDEIDDEDAEYETIGLAWEAIGKLGLPQIRKHYLTETPAVSYYAGRTGLRLGDKEGMRTVARHALNPRSPFRQQAIDELGYATELHGAGEALRKVLDDTDPDIRIRAYVGLRRHRHPSIESTVLDEDNLILDIVDSGGPFLIYVQRLGEPRVAIFGRQMKCQPPVIFPDPDYRKDERVLLTMITAQEGEAALTVFCQNRRTGLRSPRLSAPLNVGELVKLLGDRFDRDDSDNPTGLAVPYSEIVEILGALCKKRSIPASFVTEESEALKDAEQDGSRDRQESEY